MSEFLPQSGLEILARHGTSGRLETDFSALKVRKTPVLSPFQGDGVPAARPDVSRLAIIFERLRRRDSDFSDMLFVVVKPSVYFYMEPVIRLELTT
ncbi:MAG: hypothetical protein ABL999_15010 [Pyrinomonadaceae bacterium]